MPLTFPPLPPRVRGILETLGRLATVAPKEAKVTVGLDVGSSSLKLVALGPRKPSGAHPVIGSGLVPFGNPVVEDSHVTAAITQAVALPGLAVKTVNLSVSGQWVIMRVVDMPAMKPAELLRALPFEAQRHLPFQVEEVELDGVILGPAETNKVWALIVACKRELLTQRLNWLKQTGLEPGVVDVDALAVANAFAARHNGQATAGSYALLNLGAQWTNLVVLKDGIPYLVRDIPWGATRLTRQVAEQLGVEEATIAAALTQQAPPSSEVVEAMKAACESVAADVQLSFDFFESRFGSQPDRVLVSGGLSRCLGLLEAVKSHLAQPLISWEPDNGLTGQFAVAYGLALRAPV